MRYEIKENGILEKIYIFFLGFIGFSMLGQYLVLNVLHFPFYFIEWLYFPLIARYGIRAFQNAKAHLMVSSVVFGFCLLLGICVGIVQSGSVGFLQEYRNIVYIFIIYQYVKRHGVDVNPMVFINISFYAVTGELVYIVFVSNSNIVSSMNCVAIAMAIIGYFVYGKNKWGVTSFMLALLSAMLSGYRIGIVVSVCSLIVACLYILFKKGSALSRTQLIRRIIMSGVIVVLIFLVIVNYKAIVTVIADAMGMSKFAIFRITTRMEAIFRLDFSTSQDTARLKIWMKPIEIFFESILPSGIIGKRGTYVDAPITYLYAIFGSIGAIVLVIMIVSLVLRRMYERRINKVNSQLYSLLSLMFLVLAALFLLNGTFIINMYQAIMTGIILGLLCRKAE